MHSIRLNGPWEYEVIRRSNSEAEQSPGAGNAESQGPRRLDLPADWRELFGKGVPGCIRLTRRFHRPSGLDSGQRVFLAVECDAQVREITLNGRPLVPDVVEERPIRLEVTDGLDWRNTLEITVESPGEFPNGVDEEPPALALSGGKPLGLVRLEIEEPHAG